jgi:hypothetical protein
LHTVRDAIRPALQEALSPVENGIAIAAQALGTVGDGDAFVGPENDARPVGNAPLCLAGAHQTLQLFTFFIREDDDILMDLDGQLSCSQGSTAPRYSDQYYSRNT